jgi:hypothetical protein
MGGRKQASAGREGTYWVLDVEDGGHDAVGRGVLRRAPVHPSVLARNVCRSANRAALGIADFLNGTGGVVVGLMPSRHGRRHVD